MEGDSEMEKFLYFDDISQITLGGSEEHEDVDGGEKQFELLFDFRGTKPQSVEIGLSGTDLMCLLYLCQQMQARHGLPTPTSLRPKGPPSLTVVVPE
jgi:hypothetical protein